MRWLWMALLAVSGFGLAQAPAERVFRGSIVLDGNDYPVRVYLKLSGQKASGYYVYEGRAGRLRLEGTLDPKGLDLKEFDGAKPTGVFKGGYTEWGIEGDWYVPSGKRGGRFNLTEQDHRFSKARLSSVYVFQKTPETRVLYPRFEGVAWAASERVLRGYADGVLKDYREQQAWAKQNSSVGLDSFYLSMDYRLTLGSDRLLSVEVSAGIFTGGAHPSSWVRGFTLEPQTGRAVALGSLFKKGSPYLPRLLAAARRNLEGELETRGLSVQERADVLAELSTDGLQWTLGRQGIRLYFSVPHVLGDYLEALVPFKDVADILDYAGPLGAVRP